MRRGRYSHQQSRFNPQCYLLLLHYTATTDTQTPVQELRYSTPIHIFNYQIYSYSNELAAAVGEIHLIKKL